MPTIAELGFSPGKSLVAYEDVPQIQLGEPGVVGDRDCMLVETAEHTNVSYKKGFVAGPGYQLTLREDAALTNIVPVLDFESGAIEFSTRTGTDHLIVPKAEDVAANRIPVQVWGWQGEAVDQGDEIAAFASDIVGRPVRAVRISDENPRYVEGNPALGRVGFADAHAITVGCTESLSLINEQMVAQGQPPIPLRRARTTILLDGLIVPNRDKLPENIFPADYIETVTIVSDGLQAVIRKVKACGRCPLPDRNHITGELKGRPILKSLTALNRNGRHADTARYGDKAEVFWTQGFVIELPADMPEGATITVERGAQVDVTYSDTANWVSNR